MSYYWLKTFHIVGVVVWFAGLFYLVRLLVYHQEAEQKENPAKDILQAQFTIMENRLYSIITKPGMYVTVGTALGLLYVLPGYHMMAWLHAKLFFVFVLILYHFYCAKVMREIQQGCSTWSAQKLRALNELPTLLLILIVMLVIFKDEFPRSASVWLMVFLVVTMVASIQLYAKKRRRDQARLEAMTEQEDLPQDNKP